MKIFRRNLSSQARRYSQARGIIVSIPKSGRTWLRVFLQAYFYALQNREFRFDKYELPNGDKLMFTHDLWRHLTTARFGNRVRGKSLIPWRASRGKPILLLARDPRDVMVSLFFQWTRRKSRLSQMSLDDMMRDPRLGIERIVFIMNAWIAEWSNRPNFKLLRYEDCRLDTKRVFQDMLTFFGWGEIDESALARSLEFSSFENMKRMEAAGTFQTKQLSVGKAGDPESFKVRRGIVGGYKDYLSPENIGFLNQALTKLDPRYGYSVKDSAAQAVNDAVG